MSRWAALPAELDPRVRRLVVRLRRLKDHSGLSLRRLAARTNYSPKSWERYLGGRSLPPREAVEALARVGGEDPTRLLVLHEVAVEAWEKRGRADSTEAETPVPEAAVEAEPLSTEASGTRPPGRSLHMALVAGSVTLVLAVSTAALLVVRLGHESGRAAAPIAVNATSPARSAPTYTCRPEQIDGHWYAGNSRTHGAVLANGDAGPEVAEAQCLLRRAGFSPGAVDGIFGPITERALVRMQKRAGLVVDGVIGPHTWKALRR